MRGSVAGGEEVQREAELQLMQMKQMTIQSAQLPQPITAFPGHSPWDFSIKTTLESELKFCPVRIICWPPRTEQWSVSCFSTMGSSCADR